MRTALGLIALAVLGASGCSGHRGGRVGADPGAVAQGPSSSSPAPSWLPRYSAAQLELLKPVDVAIQVRATRVFPDLERFGYAEDRRLEDARDSFKVTRLVATVLQDSPRFYALDDAAPELANTVAQYGPPGAPEADAWQVTRRDAEGVGELVPAELSAASRADFDRGAAAYAKHDLDGAEAAFRAGIGKSPRVPGLHLSLAEVLAARGDVAGARKAYEAALEVDATFASAHRGLAELLLKGGDVAAARRAIAEALAYHPSSKRSLEVADRITLGGASGGRNRVPPFPIFIDVDPVGAVHVGSAAANPSRMYASCRAIVRYEPEVRATLLQQSAETPYFLSVGEEVVCLESAIGAYLFDQASGTEEGESPPERSPALEALLELAQSEGLSGYAMFEILGQHRPERARTAPPPLHRAMVKYVSQHVLASGEDPPPGTYEARAVPSARGPVARR